MKSFRSIWLVVLLLLAITLPAFALPPTFNPAKEDEAAISDFYVGSTTRIVSITFGAWDATALIDAPGANKAIVIEYFDFYPASTVKARFALVDSDSVVIHRFVAGTNAANTADNFKPIRRRVTANKGVWVKNTDAAGTLDADVSIGYLIVQDP